MISSVIAKLNCDESTLRSNMGQIAAHPALDIGELVEGRSLPITIESGGNQETEQITRWIMSLPGVDFVDVVFVHFETGDAKQMIRRSRSAEKTEN